MLGFYEEMADLAAMNEDDGFLGQCAAERREQRHDLRVVPNPVVPYPVVPSQPTSSPMSVSWSPRPRQLQFLAPASRDLDRTYA
jgi:hypothetical protein